MGIQLSIVTSFSLLLRDIGLPWKESSYLINRAKKEGFPFLAGTLPRLWKDVLQFIETGQWTNTSFDLRKASLRRWRLELSRDCIDASFLWGLSNICNYYYKLSLPFDDATIDRFASDYVVRQAEVASFEITAETSDFLEEVRRTIETDYGLDQLSLDDCFHAARHGPGSVAGGPKDIPTQVYKDSLDGVVPKGFGHISGIFRYRRTSVYTGRRMRLKRSRQLVNYCQVVFVAKDYRGPRVISKEDPQRSMLALGFHDTIKPILENATKGRIQFTDQTIFQELARQASIDRRQATLDMEAGSDRHGIRVCRRLYRNIPAIRYALIYFRADIYRVKTPKRQIVGFLGSTAGMGSGLTFPLMALTIHATICTALKRVGRGDLVSLVYVYGDDVIVPTEYYDLCVRALHRVGFHINIGKSFASGHFRESCGGDYYKGVSVTPVRLKQTFCDNYLSKDLYLSPDNKSHDKNNADKFIAKLESHCRLLVDAGFLRLSGYYYDLLEEELASRGLDLGLTNDRTTAGLCRFDPTTLLVRPASCEFVAAIGGGNFDRLIRDRLGPEKGKNSLSLWLSGVNRTDVRSLDTLCLSTSTSLLETGPLIKDTVRRTGRLVRI